MYDQSIVKRMIEGEPQAFSQVYNDWSPAVYRKAFDELNDHAKSREAVRNVFMDVYRYSPQLRDSTLFEEWLWRLVDYYTSLNPSASAALLTNPDLQIVWDDIKEAIAAERSQQVTEGETSQDDAVADAQDWEASFPEEKSEQTSAELHFSEGATKQANDSGEDEADEETFPIQGFEEDLTENEPPYQQEQVIVYGDAFDLEEEVEEAKSEQEFAEKNDSAEAVFFPPESDVAFVNSDGLIEGTAHLEEEASDETEEFDPFSFSEEGNEKSDVSLNETEAEVFSETDIDTTSSSEMPEGEEVKLGKASDNVEELLHAWLADEGNAEEWNPIIFPPDEGDATVTTYKAGSSLPWENPQASSDNTDEATTASMSQTNVAENQTKQQETTEKDSGNKENLMFFPGWDPQVDQSLNRELPTRENLPEWLCGSELPNIEGESAKEILAASRADTLPWMRFDTATRKNESIYENQFGDGGTALALEPGYETDPEVLGHAEAIEIVVPEAEAENAELLDKETNETALEDKAATEPVKADEQAVPNDPAIEYQTVRIDDKDPNAKIKYEHVPYEYIPYTEKGPAAYGVIGEEDIKNSTVELIPYQNENVTAALDPALEAPRDPLLRSGIQVIDQSDIEKSKPKKGKKFAAGAGFFAVAMALLIAAFAYAKMKGLI